ncbi:MAG: galactokinase, partial [Acidimicrobiia bacterium]|nr:galactokinase [Acidimicrobiia bacterium]
LPMAVDLGTTVRGERGGDRVVLRSDDEPSPASVALDGTVDDDGPAWAAYVAGVVAELQPRTGLTGQVSTRLPIGAGLSSSASLELAVALALGAGDDAPALARMAQRAEQQASGVPCGIMDQLTVAAGMEGHALLIDCHDLSIEPVPVPDSVDVVVVHSGLPRTLAGSAYAERRRECEAAEAVIGPLRLAAPGDERAIRDPVLRRRARHVISENARVRETAIALEHGATDALGPLMAASHASLRDDFEVSVEEVDALVARLAGTDGVHGARMTGGGFGGCVVAITRPGALREGQLVPGSAWIVRASAGARLLS